jgi:hypothetical protein
VLDDLPRDPQHVIRLPHEDVRIVAQEIGERAFLFVGQAGPDPNHLPGIVQVDLDQLAVFSGDEDITMLDTPEIWSSMSSLTWSSHPVRTQLATLNGNANISSIRRRNEVFFDALETIQQTHSFGSSPSSRRFMGHSV